MEEVQNMRQSQNDTFVICRALLWVHSYYRSIKGDMEDITLQISTTQKSHSLEIHVCLFTLREQFQSKYNKK
jgi:hypothetical protein